MIALALLISLQIATPAWAWGRLGHRVISRIAEKSLTPKAKAAIAELLEPASLWPTLLRGLTRTADASQRPHPGITWTYSSMCRG